MTHSPPSSPNQGWWWNSEAGCYLLVTTVSTHEWCLLVYLFSQLLPAKCTQRCRGGVIKLCYFQVPFLKECLVCETTINFVFVLQYCCSIKLHSFYIDYECGFRIRKIACIHRQQKKNNNKIKEFFFWTKTGTRSYVFEQQHFKTVTRVLHCYMSTTRPCIRTDQSDTDTRVMIWYCSDTVLILLWNWISSENTSVTQVFDNRNVSRVNFAEYTTRAQRSVSWICYKCN